MPLPFRVHEEPSAEKVAEFAATAANFGFNIDTTSFKSLAKSINEIPNGIISLKGGDLKDELKHFKEKKIFEISDFFSEEFFKTKRIVYVPFSD